MDQQILEQHFTAEQKHLPAGVKSLECFQNKTQELFWYIFSFLWHLSECDSSGGLAFKV